jgi:CDP-diacylglycerol--glycerol-3-phosphate 3-phosphatidyltransferase
MAKIFGSFKTGVRAAFDPMGRALVRLGVSVDAVTVAGTLGVIAGSVAFAARGMLVTATIVLTFCALVDVLDGAMARARGHSTRFGGVLDSSMDRVADGAIFGALAFWLLTDGQRVTAVVCLVALVAGQTVSYAKSRAEAAGFTCDVGFAERMERLVTVGVGALVTGFGAGDWGLALAMWLVALASIATVVQRLLHVRAQEQRTPAQASSG